MEETVLQKLSQGVELTREEEIYYLTEIVGYSKEKAERIMAIAANKNQNVIID